MARPSARCREATRWNELGQANAVQGFFEQTSFIVGPLMGGLPISVTGAWVVLGFNALTFVIAAFTVLAAPKAVQAGGQAPTAREILREIREGPGHVTTSPQVFGTRLSTTGVCQTVVVGFAHGIDTAGLADRHL
ncbi:MAG: hypothetical protein ABI746_11725, partial [Dermatophilaceae bacterium]